MSSVVIAGNTSGSVTLQAPNVAGSTTLNLPTVSGGTLVTSDSSGNVGIGTNSPAAPLHVNGYVYMQDPNNAVFFSNGAGAGYYFRKGTASSYTNLATIDASGNFSAGGFIATTGFLYFNSGYGSAGVAYGCRAWVNFNGTGTVAIRASGNVTSITDNGVGNYTINFTTAMPDANYCITSAGQYSAAGGITHSPTIGIVAPNFNANAITTTTANVNSSSDAAVATDALIACLAFFR